MPLENIGPKPASRTLVNRPNDNKAAKKPKAKATESLAPPFEKLHDHDSCEENTRGLFGQKCKRTQKTDNAGAFQIISTASEHHGGENEKYKQRIRSSNIVEGTICSK